LEPVWTQGIPGADEESATFGANVLNYSHGSSNNGFNAVTNLHVTENENGILFAPGMGQLYGHFNDDDNDGTENAQPTVLSMYGAEHPSPTDFIPSWTSGDEFALAGNPFATAVDWDMLDKQAGVGGSIWVWDPDSSKYDKWNGTSGHLTDGIIAPFQGFWMYYQSALSRVRFETTAKVSGGSFRGKESATPFRIAFSATSGRYASSTFVEFMEGGLEGVDRGDAIALRPLSTDYVLMSSVSGGRALDINRLPVPNEMIEVPIDLESTLSTDIELAVSSFNLPEGWEATLKDHLTGEETELTASSRFTVRVPGSLLKAHQEANDPRPVAVTAATAPRYTLIIDPTSSTSTKDDGRGMMDDFALEQNYPNPFNPSTQIRFTLDAGRQTRLAIYDVLGREVAVLIDGQLAAGSHSVTFDASTLTSGVYVYKLEAGGKVQTKRMTLLK
jgi:hypothetical protein